MGIVDQENLMGESVVLGIRRISICREYGGVIIEPLHSNFLAVSLPSGKIVLIDIEDATNNRPYDR